jgi:diguanylate cyclase (GGDEF)-like protein/PAS domain S-box-containing protein
MKSRPLQLSLQDHAHRHRLAHSILIGASALVVMMTVILGWALYQDYHNTLQRAGERLQTQLRAYSSAVDMAFVSADHALSHAREDIRWHGTLADDAVRMRPVLLRHLLSAPALDSLILYRPDGTTAVSTGLAAELRTGAPDWVRAALAANLHTATGSTATGSLATGSSDGRLGVSMRVTAPDGTVLGVLLATIDRDRIQSELETGEAYGGQNLMLLDSDNQALLVADPHSRRDLRPVLTRLHTLLTPGDFSGYGTRLVLGDQYLFALRQLSQQPIRALAVIERSRALAGWEMRTLTGGGVLVLVMLMTLLFLRQWREGALRQRDTLNDLAHLYQAIEQIPSPILITDLRSRIIYVNRAYLDRSGYQRHEVMGQKPAILSGNTPDATYRSLWQHLEREQPWEGEFINRMNDGSMRIEHTVITPVRDVDGEIASYFAISSDITEKREAEERLFRYRVIVDASSEMLALIDRDYRYLQVNTSYLAYHGRARDEIEGHSIAELWGEAFFNERIRHRVDQAFAGEAVSYEEWFDYRRKGRRYCKVTCNPVHGSGDRVEKIVVNISDITELKRSEQALRTSEARFRTLSEFSPMGVFEADAGGHNLYSNRHLCDMTGRSADELSAYGWAESVYPDDRDRVADSWGRTIAQRLPEWHCDARMLNGDGEVRWFRAFARRFEGEHSEDARYIGTVLDITEQIEHQQILESKNRELERLSTTDVLTGLANRGRLEELLAQEIHRYERYGSGCALIMVDVDHFKQVNDTCGHAVGDQVLRQLATLMRDNTRLSDCAGRWGGEEFLIVCPNTSLEGARQLAEALRQRIEESVFPVIGQRTCSFGVTAICPGDNARQLLQRADDALYRAKYAGRNRVEVGPGNIEVTLENDDPAA